MNSCLLWQQNEIEMNLQLQIAWSVNVLATSNCQSVNQTGNVNSAWPERDRHWDRSSINLVSKLQTAKKEVPKLNFYCCHSNFNWFDEHSNIARGQLADRSMAKTKTRNNNNTSRRRRQTERERESEREKQTGLDNVEHTAPSSILCRESDD